MATNEELLKRVDKLLEEIQSIKVSLHYDWEEDKVNDAYYLIHEVSATLDDRIKEEQRKEEEQVSNLNDD